MAWVNIYLINCLNWALSLVGKTFVNRKKLVDIRKT